MIGAFYSGTSGLKAQQTALDGISNNIANINTVGYKSKDTEFSDVLYNSMLRPDEAGYANAINGNGVAVETAVNDMSPGTVQDTGNPLNYSVNGSGFFALEDASGNRYYTRDGSFQSEPGPEGHDLCNAQGLYVLDAAGNRISTAAGSPAAAPGVFDFPNSEGLQDMGGNLFAQSAVSGAPAVSAEGATGGRLEGSNVDLAQQMTKLIETQRAYQFSSRIVQTADQIESMTNGIKS